MRAIIAMIVRIQEGSLYHGDFSRGVGASPLGLGGSLAPVSASFNSSPAFDCFFRSLDSSLIRFFSSLRFSLSAIFFIPLNLVRGT